MSDWPAPGGDRGNHDDKEEEGSALPATASWAKIGSNPSTPTLHSSLPSSRKSEGPPPLRSKGSTTSIITSIVVNNGKRKELNYTKDGSIIESPVVHSPTPAEALAIEAAAKQQMLQEQRQLQEQQRKQQQLLQRQQEAEQQAEILNQKLRKQRQLEQEQEQLELQKQKQQQEMEHKMQKQKEKEQQKKELLRQEQLQREREQQEKIQREQELKEENERKEKERQEQEQREKDRREKELLEQERLEKDRQEQELLQKEQEAKDERERKEKEAKEEQERRELEERREQEERERKEKEDRLAQQPTLSLGSFSFNPDASLSTLPTAFGNGVPAAPLGTEASGPFGLDTFAALSNLPLTPTHYTGSFNPFSLEDEPLMRRSMVLPARQFLDDSDYDPTTGRNRPAGPPIPGKPRQTSRFGFAMDDQYGDAPPRDNYPTHMPTDRTVTRDSFRALFPNVNVSFGQSDGPMSQRQQQQQQQQQEQQHEQRQQQQQSQPPSMYRSPLLHRQEMAPSNGLWAGTDSHDSYQRSMNQLNMDPMLTAPSSRMAEYQQQMPMQSHHGPTQQQQLPRSGPPGLSRNSLTPTMVKLPPPGLESLNRNEYGGWSNTHQQQQQQHQQHQHQMQFLPPHQQEQQQRSQQTSRLNSWTGGNRQMPPHAGARNSQDNAQDFFGAFLKAAAASPSNQSASVPSTPGLPNSMTFQDPAIMSVRMSSSGVARPSPVEAVQQPPMGSSAYPGAHPMGPDASSFMNDGAYSSMLQQFGLGARRMDQQHYSPLNKPANLSMDGYPPAAFGAGESPLLNTINSAAAARSAKVKSDLLMGLNAGIRPDRLSMKDQQPTTSTASLSEEHNSMLNSLNGGLRTSSGAGGNSPNFNFGNMFGNARNGGGSGFAGPGGDYSGRPSSQYESMSMNGGYGIGNNGLNSPMHSMPMAVSSSMSASVSGPPPGLGMPSGSKINSNSNNERSGDAGGHSNADNGNGQYMMSGGGENSGHGMASYLNNNANNKPMDITSMMSALDFFGPGSSAKNNMHNGGGGHWPSMASDGTNAHIGAPYHEDMSRREAVQSNRGLQEYPQQTQQQQQQQQQQQEQQQQQQQYNHTSVNGASGHDSNGNSGTNSAVSTPQMDTSSAVATAAAGSAHAATARSVEDLELQVINAKMETQLLENQLNAVIKRNRRKLYA
ncbi:hypothetical protein BGZ67_009613 [Mortierella alpina]|nr:hypothetical protein BGZ67_009613 [Mortierella alpina]